MKLFSVKSLFLFTFGSLLFSYLLSFAAVEKNESYPIKILTPYSKIINDEHEVIFTKEMSADTFNELVVLAGSYDVELKPSLNGQLKLELEGNLSKKVLSLEPLLRTLQNGKVLELSLGSKEGKTEARSGFFWNKEGWQVHFSSGGKLVVWVPASMKVVRLKTVSGEISSLVSILDTQDFQTVSGDVHVEGEAIGDVLVKTVSGTIDIEAKSLNQVEAKSVSGDLNISTEKESKRVSFESTSGDLNLDLEEASHAKISFKSVSGSMSILDGKRESSFDSNSVQQILGTGVHSLQMKSVSGDLNLTTML